LAPSSIRVLVVDDFEPFRRFICSTLQNNLELPTIREASDGLEAIELAHALQPHLVLLDIGIPKLNGIESARRIRELVPQSIILFVSQESSVEVVQGAFNGGASGYVVKMEAGRELMTAVRAVLRGGKFVGRRFAGHNFTEASVAPTSARTEDNQVFAGLQRQAAEIGRRHEAGFYSDDASLVDGFTQFIETALRARDAVIVIATELHRASLISRLQARGIDIGTAIEERRYIALDAARTLSTIMVDNMPDPARLLKVAGDLIRSADQAAKGEHPHVVVCGEAAPFLWAQGNAEAAVRLEQLWDEIARSYDLRVFCGYQRAVFQSEMGSDVFDRLCAAHSAVHSR
jgi:DNA-binding NarL/FixJ family response regulator